MPYQFEEAKLARAIRVYGNNFNFVRPITDEFGELTDKTAPVLTVKGIYHEQVSHLTLTVEDRGAVPTTVQPYIMALAKDVLDSTGKALLQQGDIINHKGHNFKVVDVTNLSLIGTVCDISLEEVV